MTSPFLDFRSDTVTRPTPAMRQAMADAELGDDVFGDDPTVIRLQERLAEMLGKEAALFVPSGTMSNQIAVRLHCRPGDELICESGCHIYNYEQGGAAQLSGVTIRALTGEYGVLTAEQLTGTIRPDNEHLVRTRMLALENTHNRGGGKVLPLSGVEVICRWAHEHGLATHLDGARLFNAVVASGIAADQWAQHFDTVSICFSKGLGAPVGSALAGPKDLIAAGRRVRKVYGGGMRQVGVIASAALFALENHVKRLADDHTNAQQLADTVREIEGFELRPAEVETNLLIFHLDPALGTAGEFAGRLADRGLHMIAFGPQQIRACTHLDVTREDVEAACVILREVAVEAASGEAAAPSKSAYSAG